MYLTEVVPREVADACVAWTALLEVHIHIFNSKRLPDPHFSRAFFSL